jgi:Regulator of Chromosome Condensation (RCC1) repeat protein
MSHLRCIPPSLPPGTRGEWVPRLTRRLAPVLAQIFVVATLGCGEEATSPATPEPTAPALPTAWTQLLSFEQISAGSFHTCGVTVAHQAYCWGSREPERDGALGMRQAEMDAMGDV